MNAKPFFDTNVLLYAFWENDARSDVARKLLAEGGVIGVQALNEFVAVARRKLAMAWGEIEEALLAIRVLCPSPVPLTMDVHSRALGIAAAHGYQIYDSLMIAAALQAECTVLYSEDLHDGQIVEGLTIRNPFRTKLTNSAS